MTNNEPRQQVYLYAVLMYDARFLWGPGFNGKQARRFAEATKQTLVRWPVQRAEFTQEGGKRGIRWHSTE